MSVIRPIFKHLHGSQNSYDQRDSINQKNYQLKTDMKIKTKAEVDNKKSEL